MDRRRARTLAQGTLALAVIVLGAGHAAAQDVALLASRTAGNAVVPALAAQGAVAPVLSFLLDHVAPTATSAVTLLEADRAAILRAENVLSRIGARAVPDLVAALASESGVARRATLARALARTSERTLASSPDAARQGAEALVAYLRQEATGETGRAPPFVREHLLLSGRTSEPAEDAEALPETLGKLASESLSLLTPLLADPDEATRTLATRALAHASSQREDAAFALGDALAYAPSPRDRARLGAALAELGGETAVLELEKGLEKALAADLTTEVRDRIAGIEATRDPGTAPRVLARCLPRLGPDEQARALAAIVVCAIPPPPPPKGRFVFDPYARRRSKDARGARAAGREAALARVGDGPVAVRLAAARALAALGRPETIQDAQVLAHKVLEAFEREPVLAVSAELARALVDLAPGEVLAEPFRKALGATLDAAPEPAAPAVGLGSAALAKAPRPPVDAASRDRLVHALLSVLGDEESDLPLLARAVAAAGLDPGARARAAAAIARLGAPGRAALDALRRDADDLARACAAAARASLLPASEATDLLDEAAAPVRSPWPLKRKAGIAVLAYAGGRSAQGIVQGVARGDISVAVRLEGTYAIARVYGKAASNTLAQALADAAPPVRRAAARELARIADPATGGAFAQAIARARKLPDRDQGEAEELLYREAIATLGKDSVPSIANIARASGDPLERRIAIAQLGRLATDEAIAFLVLVVREAKSADDRDAAAWAIERASGRDLTDAMWAPFR
jgi:hypothetical protein